MKNQGRFKRNNLKIYTLASHQEVDVVSNLHSGNCKELLM